MSRSAISVLALCFVFTSSLSGRPSQPHWIWAEDASKRSPAGRFRKDFEIQDKVFKAHLIGVADFCELEVSMNGKPIGEIESFRPMFRIEVTEHLRTGTNLLEVHGTKTSGPAAFFVRLEVRYADQRSDTIVTDKSWKVLRHSSEKKPMWTTVADLGIVADEPWGEHPNTINVGAVEDYTQWKQALGSANSADPTKFYVQPGFEIELLRSAHKDEGSWVSLEFDPKGRLIVAREDKGLLRFTFEKADATDLRVETINDTLKECRGLLYAHNALYVNANNSHGLYRLRDSNGDDRFDEETLLLRTGGSVGHGRNDLALGPDGRIYAIHGDAVEMPPDAKNLCSPLRKTSHRGRHGFVLRTDRDGKHFEIVTTGLRNPYGIDFNEVGEMFTYDADAEYDTGTPWYRPTRVHHLLPGGDYGWRAVTKTWPPYNPDQPDAAPPSLDIGRGSPTAVKFGTKSNFPAKYRRALFVLDWTYGRILAVHMTPRGASYAMRAETFAKGQPFNVTDLGFGPDGAMYIVTGGRKTQSGLYRIRFTGTPEPKVTPSEQAKARLSYSRSSREKRHRLEALAGRNTSAIQQAWTELASPDPALRHAARLAIEHQPSETWRKRALAKKRPLALLTSLLSLARAANPQDHEVILERLNTLNLEKLSPSQQLIAFRIYDIVLSQDNNLDDEVRKRCLRTLDPLYPAPKFAINQPLSHLLVRLEALRLVPRTLSLLDSATTQREQFHHLYVLRKVAKGWTPELHERYFRWLPRMQYFIGGEGMPTFIKKIEAAAIARLTEEERSRLAPLLKKDSNPVHIVDPSKKRPFVQHWKTDQLADELDAVGRGRNFERGKRVFESAACVGCHRMQRSGFAIGPDLTAVGARFSRRDILESILEPDKVVAEQYRHDVLETTDGRILVGTILTEGDYRSPELRLVANLLEPGKVVTLAKKDVEKHLKAKSSMMPQGLLDTFDKEEILDLLAYLQAGGRNDHPNYRK